MKCSAPERPQNAALAAENNKSLAALRAARDAQDAKWSYAGPQVAADQAAGSDQRTERKESSK